MTKKTIDLSKLDDQHLEIREAIAFYASHTILPFHFSASERERHYTTLEQAGYLERIT
jgi:hypothetical protein